MSIAMFVMGCIAVMAGVAMVGFGIPINEFSFGNTLIVSGTTLATGGIIMIGISAAVSQLQRIAEALAARAPVQPGWPMEAFQAPAEAQPAPARVTFPLRPVAARPSAPPAATPVPAELKVEPYGFAPTLRNPEAPPVTVEEEVSVSPPQYLNGSRAPAEEAAPASPPSELGEPGHEPKLDTGWRARPPEPPAREAPTSYFDSMWPAKPRTAPAPEPLEPPLPLEPPKAAVLKSGVVDGMAYTLYVDGSIEAELPQGTLRFASIDELRSHLEKSG